MFRNGDKVVYTGKNFPERQKNGVCVSDLYIIRDWTFINVVFAGNIDWNPINIENLEHKVQI